MFNSPVLRGILIVFLLLFSWMVLSSWSRDTPAQRVAGAIVAGLMLFFALGLLAPRRLGWIFRVLGGFVFLVYAGYFAHQVWRLLEGDAQRFSPGRPSAVMAGLGLLILGVPCLVYALSGLPPSQWATGPADSDQRDDRRDDQPDDEPKDRR